MYACSLPDEDKEDKLDESDKLSPERVVNLLDAEFNDTCHTLVSTHSKIDIY